MILSLISMKRETTPERRKTTSPKEADRKKSASRSPKSTKDADRKKSESPSGRTERRRDSPDVKVKDPSVVVEAVPGRRKSGESPSGRTEKKRDSPEKKVKALPIVVEAVPVPVPSRPSAPPSAEQPQQETENVVVKGTTVANKAGYPSIQSDPRTVVASKETKRQRAKEPVKKKENVDERRAEDVRRIREAEARGANSKPDRVRAKEAMKQREVNALKKVQKATSLERKYPRSVDWSRIDGRPLSWFSLILWSVLVCMIVLLGLSAAGSQITVTTNGVGTTNTSFTYKGSTYSGQSTMAPQDGETSLSTLPPLVTQLLALPNAPSFDCGDDSYFAPSNYGSSQVTSGLTFGNNASVAGTTCSQKFFRVGYCVSTSVCSAINGIVQADMGSCTAPSGPRRNDLHYIPSSFLEAVTMFFYLPLVLVIAAVSVMSFWTLLTPSSITLPIIAVAATGAVYTGWILGLSSNNFYILIYLGLVLGYLSCLYKQHIRVSKILSIGNRLLEGRAIDDTLEQRTSRSSSQITIPAILVAFFQASSGLALIYLLAFSRVASNFYPEPAYGQQYTQAGLWVAYGLALLNAATLSLFAGNVNSLAYPGYAVVQPYTCYFVTILQVSAFAVILTLSFLYVSMYLEYAAKYLVSRAVADWYFFGSKAYKPVPGGARTVGFKSLKLALLNEGHKIFINGFWATLANTSASFLLGLRPFLTHLLLSPVDALVYSFIGLLFQGFTKHESRFGLVHSSLLLGDNPTIDAANRLSSELVRKTYGRLFAAVGDSAEFRLMAISGNLFSTAVGLASWAWMDYLQQVDSVAQLGAYMLLVIWLTGSLVAKPAYALVTALLVDFLTPWQMNLQSQMTKNGIMAFAIMAAVTNAFVRVFLQIPTSATDSAVYCYALERTKRRRIRSLAIDEMIHKDYLGDYGKIPAGTRLERVVVKCPIDAKPGKSLLIDIDGKRYNVEIPLGAVPGRDFEAAVPIPLNNLDIPEDSSPDDDDEVIHQINGGETTTMIVNSQQNFSNLGLAGTLVQSDARTAGQTRIGISQPPNVTTQSDATVVQTMIQPTDNAPTLVQKSDGWY